MWEGIIAWSVLIGLVFGACTFLPVLQSANGKWNDRLFWLLATIALACLAITVVSVVANSGVYFYHLLYPAAYLAAGLKYKLPARF